MRKSKNRYFYHIFVSPGVAPEAITLNVVWMEREFDAYKLSRWMCPSTYNRFWDRARYLWKDMFIRFDVIHEHDGQTDRRTPGDSKDRAYASHRAVMRD